MQRPKLTLPRLCAGAIGLAALAGCASTDMDSSHGGDPYATPTAAHESKPAPSKSSTADPAKAKVQPASVAKSSPGGVSRSMLAVPTGDPETSALLLEKRVPAQVNVGETFDYEFVVQNLTSTYLENVTINDELPASFAVKSTSPSFTSSQVSKGEFPIGTLAPQQTSRVRITGAVQKPGSISSCAEVTYTSGICLTTQVVEPKLKLAASAPPEVMLCDVIPVVYVVTNTGTGPARDVRVTAKLPAGLVDQSGKSTVTFNAGNLAAGASREFTAKLKASRTGQYQNAGTAKASGDLQAQSSTVRTVVRQPVLAIAMDCPEKAFIGRRARYTFDLANTGDGVAAGTTLEATVPSNTKFVSASDGGKYSNGRVTWSIGNFPAKAKIVPELCLLYTSPSPRDQRGSRMPSSA